MTLCVYVCDCVTETKRPSDGFIRGGGLERGEVSILTR